MNRSVLSRLDQIKDVNDAIKALGQVANELTAGRNNLNDYTTLTQMPQFMVSRLSWALEGIGLNLSNNSTGSTLDIIKNMTENVKNNNYEIIINRKKAIEKALNVAQKDDLVLILGKGIDNYMAIKNKHLKYNDYDVIESYFKKLSK